LYSFFTVWGGFFLGSFAKVVEHARLSEVEFDDILERQLLWSLVVRFPKEESGLVEYHLTDSSLQIAF
jgi:hypothetical protein